MNGAYLSATSTAKHSKTHHCKQLLSIFQATIVYFSSNHCRFFNQLTSPELLAAGDNLLPEHRERYYPPTETLSMFLAQALSADRSCQ